jgi:hypothetical protein
MHHRHRLIKIAALGVLAVAIAGGGLGIALFPRLHAAAAPPDIQDYVVDFSFPLPGVTAVCGFAVRDHVQGTIREIIKMQPPGAVVIKDVQSHEFTETLYAPSTGGSLVGHLTGPQIVTLNPDGSATITASGNFDLYLAPGQGVIAQAAGHFVISLPVDGPPTMTFHGFDAGTIDSPAVCAALSS